MANTVIKHNGNDHTVKKKIRKKKRRMYWPNITRTFYVKFTDISFNIKTENSVDLHYLLYHKRTIRYAEISKKYNICLNKSSTIYTN